MERACEFAGPKNIKIAVQEQHLAGKAQTNYRRQVENWWSEMPALKHAMQRLLQIDNTKISPVLSMSLFRVSKASHRSWIDYVLDLTAVSDAFGKENAVVLDNIVHYADLHMRTIMLFRLDTHRNNPIRQAGKASAIRTIDGG